MTSLPFNSGTPIIDKSFDVNGGTKDIEATREKSEECHSVEIIDNDRLKEPGFTNSEASAEFEDESVIDPGCRHVEFILQVLEERIKWSQKKDEESEEFTRSGWRGRKLFLTLTSAQIAEETQIEDIRSRFNEFNYTVKILPSESRPDSFIILFPGRTTAQRALVEMKAIGFKLVKKRPPRPSPRCPVWFRALASLKIRRGKALSAEIIGQVKKGDHVIVNQVKGRRARLMSKTGENRGWVSVHTIHGAQLLERLDPSEAKLCLNELEM